jgi:multidrug resistance efflux pump
LECSQVNPFGEVKSQKSKQNRYENVAQAGALSGDKLEEAQLATKQQQQAVLAQKASVEAQKQTIER